MDVKEEGDRGYSQHYPEVGPLQLFCVWLLHSILFSDAASRSIGALNRINFDTKFVCRHGNAHLSDWPVWIRGCPRDQVSDGGPDPPYEDGHFWACVPDTDKVKGSAS